MFNIVSECVDWEGAEIYLETGRIARQATSAVFLKSGKTALLCTVVVDDAVKEGIDFLPLTVNCIYRSYASGRIPSGFFKREGKPSEREVLASRLIDRTLRPLFPAGFFHEIQLVCQLLSLDSDSDPDVLSLIAASATLLTSGIPIAKIPACARVGYKDGEFLLNPSREMMEESKMDLFLSGSEESVLMVESSVEDVEDKIVLEAIEFAHESLQPVIGALKNFGSKVQNSKKIDFVSPDVSELYEEIRSLAEEKFADAYDENDKTSRALKLNQAKEYVMSELLQKEYFPEWITYVTKQYLRDLFRAKILADGGSRMDKRQPDEIRDIRIEADILSMAHGSALFTRGSTQSMAITTLGTTEDEQITDDIDREFRESFMLHYNFPAYSVGEVSPLRPPGRREIGHGKLAWKALRAVLPDKEEFPYTIRVVSEITESDGSSSMASVCGGSISMMDAGVPMKAHVAGIALGLIKDKEKFVVLSDILGEEDHLGDMDFKIAGTADGITALQMDIKTDGISREIMNAVLVAGRKGLNHILGKMKEVLPVSRESVKQHAPRIVSFEIDKEKIRDVIGTGGKVIREICESSGAKVDVSKEGVIKIAAIDREMLLKARSMIDNIVTEPDVGMVYEGAVVRINDSGAFVQFFGDRWGFVHVSEIMEERVETVSSVLKMQDVVKVLFRGFDRGRAQLSMKRVNQETGELIEPVQGSGGNSYKARSGTGLPRKQHNNKSTTQGSRDSKLRNRNAVAKSKDKKPLFF